MPSKRHVGKTRFSRIEDFPKVRVRALFDTKGEHPAIQLGRKLGVSEGRLGRWMSEWEPKRSTRSAKRA